MTMARESRLGLEASTFPESSTRENWRQHNAVLSARYCRRLGLYGSTPPAPSTNGVLAKLSYGMPWIHMHNCSDKNIEYVVQNGLGVYLDANTL